MIKDPYDVVAEAREIKRQLRIKAGNDSRKLSALARMLTKEMGIVCSEHPMVNSPGINKVITEYRAKKAARMEKIDAYLARRAARTAHAKSA